MAASFRLGFLPVFVFSLATCSAPHDPLREEPPAEVSSAVTALAPLLGVGELPIRIGWGGRAVAVEINPANASAATVGTETGGLFQSTDGFTTWKHVDGLSATTPQGLVKTPAHIADVKYTSSDGQSITVTTANDLTGGGGIWRSFDGGTTWTQSVQSPTCITGARMWGIAYDASNTYVASDCGVYLANGAGAFTLKSLSAPVYSVLARTFADQSYVDTCGSDGHRRSVNWGAFTAAHAGPHCDRFVHGIDGPANDPNVIVVAVAPNSGTRNAMESDAGGIDGSWSNVADWIGGYSRELWVKVVAPPPPAHQSSGALFDLWFGDGVGMPWVTCKTPTSPRYCPYGNTSAPGGFAPWQVPNSIGGHTDINGIAVSQGCPKLMVSDAGIFKSQDCGVNWSATGTFQNGVHGGFNALQIFDVNGHIKTSWPQPQTDLYLGTMDNSNWTSASDNGYTWTNQGGEGFGFSMNHSDSTDAHVLFGIDAGNIGGFVSNANFAQLTPWSGPANVDSATYPVNFSGSTFVQFGRDATTQKVSLYGVTPTLSGQAFTFSWTTAAGGAALAAGESLHPTRPSVTSTYIYAATVRANGTRGLIRARFVSPGVWNVERADNGLQNVGAFGPGNGSWYSPAVFAAAPTMGTFVMAADMGSGEMKVSWDAGASWTLDYTLTNLLTANSPFSFAQNIMLQPHVIAMDPVSSNRVLVGTESLGIFGSTDGSATWSKIPGSEKIPNVSSFFFDESRDLITVSSYGRGLWTIQSPIYFSSGSVMRSNRTGVDWQPGFYKAECADHEALIGVSKQTGSRWSHGAFCQPRNINRYPHNGCSVRDFSAGENRGVTTTGDWDPGYFKGECAANEYAAGVSQGTDGSIKSILCCQGNVAHIACATVPFEFGEGHESGSTNPDWDAGYYKGDCAFNRYVAGMSRDLSTQPGAPHALLCCSP